MSTGMSITTTSLDLCRHCFMEQQRIGWLFCSNGGPPTCCECDRVYTRDSTEPIALANYMDVIEEPRCKAETPEEQERWRKLNSNLYDLYLRYEA